MALASPGIDVRQNASNLLLDAFLQDSGGVLVKTGTVTAKLYEVQSDGTLKSYDFNDNTFKTTTLTTETLALTYRQGNNSATDTGYWSATLTTLTGFTVGGIYLLLVNATGANPTDYLRKFQFGGAEGDLFFASLLYNGFETGTAQTGGASSITLRSGATATNDYYKDQVIYAYSGTGAGQTNRITAYVGSTKVATVETAWVTQPDNTTKYVILGRVG